MKVIYSSNTSFAIELERRVLHMLAMKYGLNDRRVIEQSEKLDRLNMDEQRRPIA